LFTRLQRYRLWIRARGRCEACGNDLDADWHAHHIARHSSGGLTIEENGRALCVPCHRREHEEMSGESTGSVFRKDYGWQERAVDALMTGISDFYSAQPGQFRHAFIVEVSPSGGKTKFSLKAAKAMIDASLIDKVVWVVPRETIKDGFKEDAEDTGLKI